MAILKNTSISYNSGQLDVPEVSSSNRPTSPSEGSIIFNTDINLFQYWNGSIWRTIQEQDNDNTDLIVREEYRYNPSYTPNLLIQVESAGLQDSPRDRRIKIDINGSQVLNTTAPRSYRATKLRFNGFSWEYITSNGYDVYGSSSEASDLDSFLNDFEDGELLIINTYDEPENNRGEFSGTLESRFGATLISGVDRRESYMLVAFCSGCDGGKAIGKLFEDNEPINGNSIRTTIYSKG